MKRYLYSFVLLLLAAFLGFSFRPATLKRKLFCQRATSWISYEGRHPLHSWKAVSKDISCVITYDENNLQIETVAASSKVLSFDSKNTNRDSHALEMLEALTYPQINFTSAKLLQKDDIIDITGNLNCHGVTRQITIKAKAITEGNTIKIEGGFPIKLADFKIERPSLLFIKIHDEIKVNFYFTFRTQ